VVLGKLAPLDFSGWSLKRQHQNVKPAVSATAGSHRLKWFWMRKWVRLVVPPWFTWA